MKSKLLNKVMDFIAITLTLFLAISRTLSFSSLYPATDTLGGWPGGRSFFGC